MRSSGNGRPEVCAANLLMMSRGEVPYDRLRGLPTEAVDLPYDAGRTQLLADARWLISTYEPRIDIKTLRIESLLPEDGLTQITAKIHTREV